MYKIKEKYKNCSLFIKICMYLLHFAGVLIRGTIFLIFKLLYRVLKLWEFERIRDNVFLTKSDGLTHSFNFKRSPYFKKTYHNIKELLNYYRIMVRVDNDNGSNKSDEVLDEIMETVDKLVILSEKEAMTRSFKFATRRKKGMAYTDHGSNVLDFYLENQLNDYNHEENSLDYLKENN